MLGDIFALTMPVEYQKNCKLTFLCSHCPYQIDLRLSPASQYQTTYRASFSYRRLNPASRKVIYKTHIGLSK